MKKRSLIILVIFSRNINLGPEAMAFTITTDRSLVNAIFNPVKTHKPLFPCQHLTFKCLWQLEGKLRNSSVVLHLQKQAKFPGPQTRQVVDSQRMLQRTPCVWPAQFSLVFITDRGQGRLQMSLSPLLKEPILWDQGPILMISLNLSNLLGSKYTHFRNQGCNVDIGGVWGETSNHPRARA